MRAERNETNARIAKMEDEIMSLRSLLSLVLNNGSRQNIAYPLNSSSFNEREFLHSSARSSERHPRRYSNVNDAVAPNENEILSPLHPLPHENRSSDKMHFVPGYLDNLHLNGHVNGAYSTPENEASDSDIMQREKETFKLRKELQDVKDSKQKADSKIQEYVANTLNFLSETKNYNFSFRFLFGNYYSLEHIVKSLQNKMSQSDSVPKTFDHGTSAVNRKSIENGSSQGKLQTMTHSQTKSRKMLSTSWITGT